MRFNKNFKYEIVVSFCKMEKNLDSSFNLSRSSLKSRIFI